MMTLSSYFSNYCDMPNPHITVITDSVLNTVRALKRKEKYFARNQQISGNHHSDVL